MGSQKLFEPLKVGRMQLKHRVVMAPLTRMRATVPGNTANDMNAVHYGQRASEGGLIIAEASQVVPGGSAAPTTPGIPREGRLRLSPALARRARLALVAAAGRRRAEGTLAGADGRQGGDRDRRARACGDPARAGHR